MIVLDTHALLWFTADDPLLSNEIKDLLEVDARKVFVPSICLWEIVMLAQKGRLDIGEESPEAFTRSLFSRSNFKEVPLNFEIAILSRTLAFNHNDPADRFIAATAKYLGMPLVTVDPHLTSLSWLKTIS